ncbi:MAG: glycosyltransferase [Paludibacteraceae bacterium]|nr:glycosyltransferase [Paludibacteraceae bacterium]
MKNPLVSICCITYNHAPFIRQALDGFLMQEAPTGVERDEEWLEILVHDDASTDGTDAIIREYASKYPTKIYPLYEQENQYSKGVIVDGFNYKRARGKYIAYCEGDDYWTDAQKLRKQVDFMESHPDYSLCFHACLSYDFRKKAYVKGEEDWKERFTLAGNEGFEVTRDKTLREAFDMFPLSMVFRMSMYNLDWLDSYKGYRDTHEIYLLLREGKGYFMNFIGGTHVRHDGGVVSSRNELSACKEAREIIRDLYVRHLDDVQLREYLKEVLVWNYDTYREAGRKGEFLRIWLSFLHDAPQVALQSLYVILKRGIKRKCQTLISK